MSELFLEQLGHEYKREFTGNPREWVEIVKDIIAIANSGGGKLYLGVNDDGQPSGCTVAKVDPATITDKISKYTDVQFSNFSVSRMTVREHEIIAISIGENTIPTVFTAPGTYVECPKTQKQTTAFKQGTIYFRHGAKSEPANQADIDSWAKKYSGRAVQALKENLRQVVELPAGQRIQAVAVNSKIDAETNIRITNDPNAEVARLIDPYSTHPYRRTELVAQFNQRMKDKVKISAHDIQCLRKVHKICERADFYYKPPIKNSSPVYSDLFLHWMVEQYNGDSKFFENARKIANPSRLLAVPAATAIPLFQAIPPYPLLMSE